jgi:TetR/AcrR family transcriptional regulator, regulator of autoinduction and epiphytic fitness
VQEAAAPLDGRTRRSLRTRESIVDATIALVEDGDLRPTAPRVAERAGVSVRSVFQHFDDLESLHAAVALRLVERVAVLVVPVDPSLPLRERLERFVYQRCLLLEAVTPIRRAADVHRPFSAEITARLRDGQAFLRAELEATFAPEIVAAGPAGPDLLDALDTALSWSAWEGLRAGLGRERADAERVLRQLAASALHSARIDAMMDPAG